MLGAAVIAAVIGAGCGAAAHSKPKLGASPARDFVDVFSADLAGDRNWLALAVVGRTRGAPPGRQVVRAYIRGRAGGWRRTPPLRRSLAPGAPVALTYANGIPCIAYEGLGGRRLLACLKGGRWRELTTVGLSPQRTRLFKLASFNGRLVLALQTLSAGRRGVVVLRLARGRWRRLGQHVPTGEAVPALGESSRARGTLDLALSDVATGARLVWSLAEGRWHRHQPLGESGGGPMPGGTARLGARLYLPVIDATAEPWAMSVHVLRGAVWSQVGELLNRGAGNAQGVLSVAGRAVWAAWQENEPRDDGLFNTRMYFRRVAPVAGRAREVWAGASIGPGSVETVRGAGRQWILYMPEASARRRLTVAVKPLR